MQIKKGVKLIDEEAGEGLPVEMQENYLVAIRITLNKGEVVKHPDKCLNYYYEDFKVLEDGYFQHKVRIDRENLIPGIFYALQGMNIGGYRKVEITPHLGYGEKGIQGIIPPNAKLIVEIKVLEQIKFYDNRQ